MTTHNEAPLSERLEALSGKFWMAYEDDIIIREAAELARRVEGATTASLTVEPYHRFVLRDADPTILALDGKCIRLVPVEG